MPYVAKEVYAADQTTLGTMVAAAATGALTGSLIMSRYGGVFRPGRAMLGFGAAWLLMLLVFAQTRTPATGIPVLLIAGCMQTMGLIPIYTLLLRTSDQRFRGRIMGLRMLAIYGNLPGLLIAGPLIARIGYTGMASSYALFGLFMTALIAVRWRSHIWRADAPENVR
jgi:hypothetical protein